MDRFYPLGLPADADSWKTTYEVANEMRSFARSAYPPGTSVHQPGARDFFGYSTPGPIADRLARPDLCLTDRINVPNPREHHALTRVQIDDDRHTFHNHDTQDMLNHSRSPVASAALSPAGGGRTGGLLTSTSKSLARTRSLPALIKTSVPPKLSDPATPIDRHEDDHFDYFIPRSQQKWGKEKINPHTLSKLQKSDWHRISFPFTGEGTGFRSAGGLTDALPQGHYKEATTSHRTTYQRPPFHRPRHTVGPS